MSSPASSPTSTRIPLRLALPPSPTGPNPLVTISVKAINVGTADTALPASRFVHPVSSPGDALRVPIYAFLLEHPSAGNASSSGDNPFSTGTMAKRLLFDLGMRKDRAGLSPSMQTLLGAWNANGFRGLVVEEDIVDQLARGGVKPGDVDGVIWSHTHLDHIGDLSKFPTSVELVVGPQADLRTYPSTPGAIILEDDLKDRKITELTDFPLKIGEYDALDYFGDGSMYILDAPGHCMGHISALVRVTPTSFVLLGGDTCHHAAQVRPNKHCACPGELLSSQTQPKANHSHPSHPSHTQPFLTLPQGPSAYHDLPTARTILAKLAALDADPDVFVLLAHDSTLVGVIDEFPGEVNEWKAKGWKDQVVWRFLDGGHVANLNVRVGGLL